MSQTIYKEYLSEPWFSLILLGLKTCEGRLHKHRFQTYKEGDIIMWFNDDFGKTRFVMTEITYVKVYPTFEDFLKNNFYSGLKDSLPGMPSLSHGLQVYQKYFTKKDETKYGVVSFDLKVLKYKLIVERKDYLEKEVLGYFSSVEECFDSCYEKFKELIDEDKWTIYYNELKEMIKQKGIEYLDRGRNLLWDRKFNLLRSKEDEPDFNCIMIDLTDAEMIDYYNHLLEHNFEVDEEDLAKDTNDFIDEMIDEDELRREEIEKCERMERKRLNDIAWDILQHLPEELEKDEINDDKTSDEIQMMLNVDKNKNPALFTSFGRL
jgi:ASC-1-like (ASCH) protein